jgi:SET domain-containing protein
MKRGFLIPVELRYVSESVGQGVFALESVAKGTAAWTPNLVEKYSPTELETLLKNMTSLKAHEFLRQGFVLSSDMDHFCANVDDLGRYTNHSSNPNMGYADFTGKSDTSVALRDIALGEEITCDYSGLGSPQWYKDLCLLYNVVPTDEVARMG